ncbi:MAG: MMPL family transporter [Gammaproteobacteria bacterium]|nr:MMPL family transporter [Gammaproteobacteria bacterium]
MKNLLTHLSLFFETIPDRVRRGRWLFWTAFILVLAGYGSGAGRFQLDLTDEGFFSKDDPVRVAFNQFRAQFGGNDDIYIVYKPKDGDVFSEASLTAVRGLQEELLNYRLQLAPGQSSPLDHVLDVKTIVNTSYLQASTDALISRQFIGEDIPSNQQALEEIRRAALAHPDYPLLYVSKDTSYGGIMIRTDLGSKPVVQAGQQDESPLTLDDLDVSLDALDITDAVSSKPPSDLPTNPEFEFVDPKQYVELFHTIESYLDKPQYREHLQFHPVGNAVVHTYVMDVMFEQINNVMGFSVLLIILMLWVLFRSASSVIWPVVIIGSASLLTLATLGWFELRMNMMVNITIFLVLVVGVADSVHLLSGYIYFRNHGQAHEQALRSAYRNAGTAILLTSVTTAMGMLALFMVPIDAIQIFGFSAAVGVMFAFVVSVIMLPLMLDIWRPYKKLDASEGDIDTARHHIIQRVLRRVEHYSHARPGLNIALFTVLLVVFAFGLSKIEVDSNPMSLFDPEVSIVKDFRLVDDNMGGTQNVEVMIDMGRENGLKDPVVLNAMQGYQEFLVQAFPDEVIRTNSLVNIVRDSNKSLNGGRSDFYVIPQDPRVLDQTLFLFNNANPSDRRLVVSDDYRLAHISASFANVGSKRYIEVLNAIEPELETLFEPLRAQYPSMKITLTGGMTIYAKLLDMLSWSQVKGFGLALLMITVLLFVVFSSYKLGLIAIYPNIFPLVVMFGLMGYLGIALDVDTLIVAPLMIGIVVDDTIHFMNHYRAEVQKHGDVYKGIQIAFREVGQAIAFTSIILAVSFLAMAWLDHQGLKNFGILSSITIITALLAELFLLPALLVKMNADMGKQTRTGASPAGATV